MPETKKKPKSTEYTVEQAGYLLEFLLSRVKNKSRNAVKHLLSARQVQVDGKVVTRFDAPLAPGQTVSLLPPSRWRPGEAPFPILYEDDGLIAIEKPAGLLTVANEKEREHTAYRILNDHFRALAPENRLYVVHRLDKDTSGVLLFAKDQELKHTLQERWDELVKRRVYLAAVEGAPKEAAGTVRSWLKETAAHTVYSAGPNSGGKEAVTRYETLSSGNGYTLLRVELDTGRKNQIRVHMRDLGCCVTGDKKYGTGAKSPLGRLGLHACELALEDPRTGKELSISAPTPKSFHKLVRTV